MWRKRRPGRERPGFRPDLRTDIRPGIWPGLGTGIGTGSRPDTAPENHHPPSPSQHRPQVDTLEVAQAREGEGAMETAERLHGETLEEHSEDGRQDEIVGDRIRPTCTHSPRTNHWLEGAPLKLRKHPNPSLRAKHQPEGTPLDINEYPNPSLRAYHWPEGTPLKFSKHPNPGLRANHCRRSEDIPFTLRQEESNKTKPKSRTKKDRSKRRSSKHKHETGSLSERQGETLTSRPGAMRRQKR